MKVIIAGSRGLADQVQLAQVMTAFVAAHGLPTEVVSGGARGVDQMGEAWARAQGIPVRQFLPDWDTYGRAAGPRRNGEMAAYADALVAIWDGRSRGTLNMIEQMRQLRKPVYIHRTGR